MQRSFLSIFFFAAISFTSINAQTRDTIRVCTWNVMNFSETSTPERHQAMQTVMGAIRPDVLVVQEVHGHEGAVRFWNYVLRDLGIQYAQILFFDGPDSDNAIFINLQTIDYFRALRLLTEQRDINGWILVAKSTGDTFNIYSAHLKEGVTQADRDQRDREARILRQHLDSLPNDSKHIVAGDLNVYTSNEPAYQALTIVGIIAAGEVHDPINRPGDWSNSEEFADIHTRSTRVRSFNGGATGGLNHRFDQILISGSLLPHYRDGSYTTFGNDANHFNDSINARPNFVVAEPIANALHMASDHLPVYLDLIFSEVPTSVDEEPMWRSREMDLSEKN